MTIQDKIAQGKVFLGIELGSTRIKASLIDCLLYTSDAADEYWCV